ncbi:sporulation protein YpjB [Heyndrickxia ginsengihumi]|uniref:Sporulation protein n=1 Tax=Heyndrickxia ginsengihumi TaxID=363870 RepID=A0A0A6VAG9_9BACI|nr:sporulation protein YpjB [Heyndrickxia ginsengihumi]KHD84503.1 sporulation protein [Heyndrickxia ginsengihumi]MBE6183493.1 sporulation protein YpjB [Bacillus sp. (in: firmicutes)]MCM3022932.1 sporulation protein YpjB [Heyndrickxia ginsengihumi]NEY20640.1 sporulation protein YpjB [Heyndrickxia ginsengihumi]
MKTKLIILLCSFLFLFAGKTVAQTNTSSLSNLNNLSDEALQLTKNGRYAEAKQLLEKFSKEFTEITLSKNLLTMDELRILTVTHDEALQSLTKASVQAEDKIDAVTTFRLVIDALNSKYQPMWTEMREPVMTSFAEVKKAAKKGDSQTYNLKLNDFLKEYSMIQPSLKVDIPTEQIQKLDAEVAFIDQYRSNILNDKTHKNKELNALQDNLQHVFDQMSEDETDPSLWWVIISTGSIIILTLSYVGWRKYKGQKEDKQQIGHND